MDVVIEEATEDLQMMGAVQPIEDPYFATGFWTFITKRAPWLIVLFAGELLTANVMHGYQSDVAAMVDLIIFIPLIISSGGNSGSQSSSLIIRALAIGEVQPAHWRRILVREVGIGIVLGLVLALVGFARAYFMGTDHPVQMGLAVAVSVLAVVTMGTLVGSLLPLAIKRVGLDPAVSSTPFIASVVDVLGILVYFTISRLIFAELG
jgi:magnesium transporter